jgi:hypothetical protein
LRLMISSTGAFNCTRTAEQPRPSPRMATIIQAASILGSAGGTSGQGTVFACTSEVALWINPISKEGLASSPDRLAVCSDSLLGGYDRRSQLVIPLSATLSDKSRMEYSGIRLWGHVNDEAVELRLRTMLSLKSSPNSKRQETRTKGRGR